MTADFAPVVIHLLKGCLFQDEALWKELLTHQKAVRDYIARIGLQLVLHESDGYAFLTQNDAEEEGPPLPRLTRKAPLSFEVSLLCVLLREELDTFDAGSGDASRLYLTLDDFRERLRIYFKEKADEIRLYRELDRYVSQVEKAGLIRQINRSKPDQDPVYEVLRLIKAKVDPDFISEFKRKLDDYAESL